jgi:CYTH domain-containing protein
MVLEALGLLWRRAWLELHIAVADGEDVGSHCMLCRLLEKGRYDVESDGVAVEVDLSGLMKVVVAAMLRMKFPSDCLIILVAHSNHYR